MESMVTPQAPKNSHSDCSSPNGPLSSHPVSPDETPARSNGLSNSWNTSGSARKRNYSNIGAHLDEPSSQLQSEFEAVAGDEHNDKRSRGPHWPLSPDAIASSSKSSRTSRTPKQASSRSRRRIFKSSKFMEGSMRDRESLMPPEHFMNDDLSEESDENKNRSGAPMNNYEMFHDAGIDRNKTGGMYRFGKAIANAFNPGLVWQGVTGMFSKDKSNESPYMKMMDERKALAERNYAELKSQGFQGTNKDVPGRTSADHSINGDSGIDMESYRSSRELKRDPLIFDEHGVPWLAPPPIPDSEIPSPSTENDSRPGTTKKQYRRRPSLPSLKKVKSHFSLAALRKDPDSPLPSVEASELGQRIKKQQSKKDLQKQVKLTKKISNLEAQLEKARQELNRSRGVEDEEAIIKKEHEDHDEMADIEEAEFEEDNAQKDEEIAEEENPYELASQRQDPRASRVTSRQFIPTLPSLPSERLLSAAKRRGQTPASVYPNRDLPPKTVNPSPLALSLEKALGMHEQDKGSPVNKSKSRKKPVVTSKSSQKTPNKSKAAKAISKNLSPMATRSKTRGAGRSSKALTSLKAIEAAVISHDKKPETAKLEGKLNFRTRRKSDGQGLEDETYELSSEGNSNKEQIESSNNSPEKRVTRSGNRKISVPSKTAKSHVHEMAEVLNEAATKEAAEGRKVSSSNRNPRQNNSDDQDLGSKDISTSETNNSHGKRQGKDDKITAESSTSNLEKMELFAEATAFAPESTDAVKTSSPLPAPDKPFTTMEAPKLSRRNLVVSPSMHQITQDKLSPLTALEASARIGRSMSPPPTATFSKLAALGPATLAGLNSPLPGTPKHTRPERKDSLAHRSTSPEGRSHSSTAVPLPRGSPIRGSSVRSPMQDIQKGLALPSSSQDSSTQTSPNRNENLSPLSALKMSQGSSPRAKSSGSLGINWSPEDNSPSRRNTRGKVNGSPKPILKRAGRDGPITVTPSRGRGVPPVPRIPDGTIGKRSVVTKARKENGKSVNLEDGWNGWDEDVF